MKIKQDSIDQLLHSVCLLVIQQLGEDSRFKTGIGMCLMINKPVSYEKLVIMILSVTPSHINRSSLCGPKEMCS